MASKIHTDNPKHHKYVTTNKKERKKNNIFNISYNNINVNNLKNFLLTLEAVIIDNFTYTFYKYYIYKINKGIHTIYKKPNYHATYHNSPGMNPSYHGKNAPKGSNIIYNDCNHKTFRVTINRKYVKDRDGSIKTFKKDGLY